MSRVVQVPKVLYKYRSFDSEGYNLRIISDQELWLSSARHFNDPFDSVFSFDYRDSPPGIMKRWGHMVHKRHYPDEPKKARRAFVRKRLKQLRSNPEELKMVARDRIEKAYNTFGICCLTPRPDNLLMWSHYADGHRGFCVGISVDSIRRKQMEVASGNGYLGIEKVKYAESMPLHNYFQVALSKEPDGPFFEILSTKYQAWSYEEEYRLICMHRVDQVLKLDGDSITEIILGCSISDTNRGKILQVAREANLSHTVKEARMKEEGIFGISW